MPFLPPIQQHQSTEFVTSFLLSLINSERILKIGQYLLKLWARVRCLVFLTYSVDFSKTMMDFMKFEEANLAYWDQSTRCFFSVGSVEAFSGFVKLKSYFCWYNLVFCIVLLLLIFSIDVTIYSQNAPKSFDSRAQKGPSSSSVLISVFGE